MYEALSYHVRSGLSHRFLLFTLMSLLPLAGDAQDHSAGVASAQDPEIETATGAYEAFLTPSTTFDRKRFFIGGGIAAGLYAGASVGLYAAWYRGQGTGRFQTIDDSREWEGMDKVGHGFTAYMYSGIANQGLEWAGVPRTRRLLLTAGTALLLQSTIEVMDGFSPAWGFSWYDMGANLAGTALFVSQEAIFREQRVLLKFSASRQYHSKIADPSQPEGGPDRSPNDRAVKLYGATAWTKFIKDYGGQTVWVSVNPAVLLGRASEARLSWLNLAVGYSPNNIYGAFYNSWSEQGFRYSYDEKYPRTHDFVLSLDADLTRVPTRSKTLKTVLFFANFVKIPAPALVLNNESGARWSWLYF